MTPEQEKVLVNAVERITVLIQHIDYQALRKAEIDRAGELNMALCDAFPWLREEPPS